MAFTGEAPETINGRLAMLGFVSAVAAELTTQESIAQQFVQAPDPILLTFSIFTLASFVTISKYEGLSLGENAPFFNRNVSSRLCRL